MGIIHVMDETDAGRVEARQALARLDLNVVVHLDALLSEMSVTRAAARLNLSQPAMSAALSRLRSHFDDPLLVRAGRGWSLSPLGARLAAPTARMVDGLHGVFGMSAVFDPAEEAREFVLHASDHSAAVVGAQLRARVGTQAPSVRLRFVNREISATDSPGALLARCDAALLPHGILFDSPHLDVFEDRWVCIVSDDNRQVGEELSLRDMAQLPWIAAHHGPLIEPVLAPHLAKLGIRPRIDTVVDSFLAAPWLVAGTQAIGVVQQRLLARLPPSVGVRRVGTPFEITPHRVALWWHPVHTDEPAHSWLRSQIADVARVL